jgi:hypothetical protein
MLAEAGWTVRLRRVHNRSVERPGQVVRRQLQGCLQWVTLGVEYPLVERDVRGVVERQEQVLEHLSEEERLGVIEVLDVVGYGGVR